MNKRLAVPVLAFLFTPIYLVHSAAAPASRASCERLLGVWNTQANLGITPLNIERETGTNKYYVSYRRYVDSRMGISHMTASEEAKCVGGALHTNDWVITSVPGGVAVRLRYSH